MVWGRDFQFPAPTFYSTAARIWASLKKGIFFYQTQTVSEANTLLRGAFINSNQRKELRQKVVWICECVNWETPRQRKGKIVITCSRDWVITKVSDGIRRNGRNFWGIIGAKQCTLCWMASNTMNDVWTRMQFREMDEGRMSEYYSDAMDKVMTIDNRRIRRKQRAQHFDEVLRLCLAK